VIARERATRPFRAVVPAPRAADPLARREPLRSDRLPGFAAVSVGLHLAAVAAALAWWLAPPPRQSEVPATIQVLFGDNADQSGAKTPAASPAHAAPSAPPAAIARRPADGDMPGGAAAATSSATPPAPTLPVRLGDGQLGLKLDDAPDPNMIEAQADPGNRAPKYPQEAALQRQQGRVVIRLHIDTQGRVSDAEILQSSGHPALDRAARDALAKWRFIPALRDGVAVPSFRDQSTDFVLE
jgi:protein TonB